MCGSQALEKSLQNSKTNAGTCCMETERGLFSFLHSLSPFICPSSFEEEENEWEGKGGDLSSPLHGHTGSGGRRILNAGRGSLSPPVLSKASIRFIKGQARSLFAEAAMILICGHEKKRKKPEGSRMDILGTLCPREPVVEKMFGESLALPPCNLNLLLPDTLTWWQLCVVLRCCAPLDPHH